MPAYRKLIVAVTTANAEVRDAAPLYGAASLSTDGLCGNGSEVGAGGTAVESAPDRDIHAELTLAAFHREVAK
jgi:hypothetical protein